MLTNGTIETQLSYSGHGTSIVRSGWWVKPGLFNQCEEFSSFLKVLRCVFFLNTTITSFHTSIILLKTIKQEVKATVTEFIFQHW